MPEEGVKLSPGDNLLSTKEIIEIAKLFVRTGVKKIRFTGGEPLVRSDLCDILCKYNFLCTLYSCVTLTPTWCMA